MGLFKAFNPIWFAIANTSECSLAINRKMNEIICMGNQDSLGVEDLDGHIGQILAISMNLGAVSTEAESDWWACGFKNPVRLSLAILVAYSLEFARDIGHLPCGRVFSVT